MKRLLAVLTVISFVGCYSGNAPAPSQQAQTIKEIPITSTSLQGIEHFKKGRDLADNLRQTEALQELDEALKLDPNFALARAYQGNVTPGAKGLAAIEDAKTKAAKASTTEQLVVDAMLAGRRGEFAKSVETWKRVVDAAPADWRAHYGLAIQLQASEKYADAIAAYEKATAINPNAGPVYNNLGYAYLAQGQAGPAIEAFKKYSAINPDEPNPQDSLAEALMAGGQLSEAEAAFTKAAKMGTGFPVAWEGVAYAKFFAGDWAGGRQALSQARAAATRPEDRMEADTIAVVATFGEGRTAEAMKQLEALSKSPDASSTDGAFLPLYRAMALVDGGRYRDAMTDTAKATERADSGQLPPFTTANLKRLALVIHSAAAGLSGDAAGVQSDIAALEKEAAARPDVPQVQSSIHFAQGMLANAQKDVKAARAHFEQCSDRDTYCSLEGAMALQKAGDSAGAEGLRARITKSYLRDPVYLYARSVLNRTAPRPTN